MVPKDEGLRRVEGSTAGERAGEVRVEGGRKEEGGGKWEEAGEKSERMEDEREDEWEQELPSYYR